MLGPAGYMVVAHRTLLSSPVPIGIGIWGLGLGLDNFLKIGILELTSETKRRRDVILFCLCEVTHLISLHYITSLG